MKHRLGVCSWSLQSTQLDELVERIREVGLRYVQLALDPITHGAWTAPHVKYTFEAAGLEIRSGMMAMEGEDYSTLETIRKTGGMRSTKHLATNLAQARKCADAARALGLDLVSFHAGFLPHSSDNPERLVLLERLRMLVDIFTERDVRLAFETGQETAETLLDVLEEFDHSTVGVNFDPANMILYAMGDPVAALETLGDRVFQVHIKDATATTVPGTWGTEVPVGAGEVDWRAFFAVLSKLGLACDLMIEREANDERVADMRKARDLLEGLDVVEGPA